MKKLAILGICAMLTVGGRVVDINEDIYPMSAIVTEVNYTTDTVTIRNFTGFEYQFEGAEDWMEGDICACIMDSKGTQDILDDEIIKTKYDGYIY